jgi:signal transduction histidine kinase
MPNRFRDLDRDPAGGKGVSALSALPSPRVAPSFSIFLQGSDSGAGTDRALEDLVQPLTSGSRAGGHGLGLWIVREVAELYGGELWMAGHGELGGATFTVMFPGGG